MGYALPRNVTYYDVPPTLLYELPSPPSGYRYVRMGGDILLVAVATSIVIDAIQNIFD
jgi:Ni/Co efflux regulator RcnB